MPNRIYAMVDPMQSTGPDTVVDAGIGDSVCAQLRTPDDAVLVGAPRHRVTSSRL